MSFMSLLTYKAYSGAVLSFLDRCTKPHHQESFQLGAVVELGWYDKETAQCIVDWINYPATSFPATAEVLNFGARCKIVVTPKAMGLRLRKKTLVPNTGYTLSDIAVIYALSTPATNSGASVAVYPRPFGPLLVMDYVSTGVCQPSFPAAVAPETAFKVCQETVLYVAEQYQAPGHTYPVYPNMEGIPTFFLGQTRFMIKNKRLERYEIPVEVPVETKKETAPLSVPASVSTPPPAPDSLVEVPATAEPSPITPLADNEKWLLWSETNTAFLKLRPGDTVFLRVGTGKDKRYGLITCKLVESTQQTNCFVGFVTLCPVFASSVKVTVYFANNYLAGCGFLVLPVSSLDAAKRLLESSDCVYDPAAPCQFPANSTVTLV